MYSKAEALPIIKSRPLKTNALTQPKIGRSNNFDFLRVAFALFVIVSHSYPLFGLPVTDDPLYKLSGTNRLSDLGLAGFFCISGYLVYQSSQRSKNYRSFISKRILRIYPGLIVNVLLIALVLGGVVAGSLSYYRSGSVYTFIASNLGLFNIQFRIPGFFSGNPYKEAINGSLWTIPYEMLFYLLFFVFYLSPKVSRLAVRCVIPAFFLGLVILPFLEKIKHGASFTQMNTGDLLQFGVWFLAGASLSQLSDYVTRYGTGLAIVSAALMTILFTGYMKPVLFSIIWPVFVISFGSCKTWVISKLDKIGDPSYGVYIYGFAIQQTLIHYFYRDMSLSGFMALSIVLSVFIGYLSWFLIEKKALRWEKKGSVMGKLFRLDSIVARLTLRRRQSNRFTA